MSKEQSAAAEPVKDKPRVGGSCVFFVWSVADLSCDRRRFAAPVPTRACRETTASWRTAPKSASS